MFTFKGKVSTKDIRQGSEGKKSSKFFIRDVKKEKNFLLLERWKIRINLDDSKKLPANGWDGRWLALLFAHLNIKQ
jgi:hypothetical protein